MTETIAFPDVETLLVGYLKAQLAARSDTATVATKVPNPRPRRLVRLLRAGGARKNLVIDSPTVVVECWDADETAAAELVRLVRALIWAMPGTSGVYRVGEFAGPASQPDPESGSPRYVFTVSVDVRGFTL